MSQYSFYMYWGEMECMGQSFACKLGLHPLTLAHLSSIASNFEKWALAHLSFISQNN
jgi:hypothetical protein